MQFLSPAHLVFVLWLLAAAAPVATVLINGSMVPLVGTNVRAEEVASFVESKVQESRVQSRPRASIAHGGEDVGPLGFGLWTSPVSSSVLHTELQRHRPRVA